MDGDDAAIEFFELTWQRGGVGRDANLPISRVECRREKRDREEGSFHLSPLDTAVPGKGVGAVGIAPDVFRPQ